jgi:hypothetical protein
MQLHRTHRQLHRPHRQLKRLRRPRAVWRSRSCSPTSKWGRSVSGPTGSSPPSFRTRPTDVFSCLAIWTLRRCDGDALVVVVDQDGHGACHTGERSCFYRSFGEPSFAQRPAGGEATSGGDAIPSGGASAAGG